MATWGQNSVTNRTCLTCLMTWTIWFTWNLMVRIWSLAGRHLLGDVEICRTQLYGRLQYGSAD